MRGDVLDKTQSAICEASTAIELARKESQSEQRDVKQKDGQGPPPIAPSAGAAVTEVCRVLWWLCEVAV